MGNLNGIFGDSGFNANDVNPTSSFDPIPKGKYPVVVSASEVKQTKARDGEYLQLTLEVIDGQYKGRKVWARLNIRNKSKDAEDIGRRQLSALCHATGIMTPKESSEFHNKPIIADIKISRDGDQNEVQTFAAMGGASKPAGGFQPPKAQGGSSPQHSNTSSANTAEATQENANATTSHSSAAVPPWKR